MCDSQRRELLKQRFISNHNDALRGRENAVATGKDVRGGENGNKNAVALKDKQADELAWIKHNVSVRLGLREKRKAAFCRPFLTDLSHDIDCGFCWCSSSRRQGTAGKAKCSFPVCLLL